MAAVSAVVLAIFIVELLFGLLLAFSPQTNVEWKGSITERFYTSDPLLGYKPEPGITATASKIVNGQAVYDVRYSIDDAGRRLTPASAADAAGPIVLFFGDSNMFGEGVEDDQTTPNQFALLAPQPVTVLNYGFSGYGPNQMLAMLEAGRLDPVVRDKDVIAIYGYIDGHIHRVIGGMNVVTWWAIDTPRYVRDDSGRPVYADSFARSRPVVNWFYAVFSRSRTVRYFGIDLPLRRKEHLLLTADVIRRSAEELKSRARSSRFYVLVWPTTSTSGLLREAFVGAPVEVLDYSTQWQQHDLRYEYPHDRHPTPAGHRLAAGLLSDDITVRPADDK